MQKYVEFGSSAYGVKAFEDRYAQYHGETIEDVWRRVAKFAASDNGAYGWDRERQEEEFYLIMSQQLFTPAGRILSNCGGTGNGNPGNCFGLPIEDSRESILKETLGNFGEIAAHGGGIGINFSNLRPNGAVVEGARSIASGPCSFINVYQAVGGTVKQGGSRGLAAIAILNVDHPEIEKFISRKSESDDVWNNFNVSVGISDKFMEAVAKGRNWNLKFDGKIYKTVKARELWHKIAEYAHKSGEPGVLFLDNMNKYSPISYATKFDTCNPCGEIPSITRDEKGNPQAGMCCLGSLILPNFYDVDSNDIDLALLERVIKVAILMLDNLIDNGSYPLELNKETMQAYRPIGLGFFGLSDLFFLKGLPYGQHTETVEWLGILVSHMREAAYGASSILADDLREFPKYDAELDNTGKRRNSTLLSFAPTGTISALYGASWGIEPYYAVSMRRNEELGTTTTGFSVLDNWRKENLDEPWPSHLRVVHAGNHEITELTTKDHLAIMDVLNKYVDNSISKTVNLPKDATVEDVMEVYQHIWENRGKGCTVYREGCRSINAVEVDTGEEEAFDYDLEIHDLIAEPREVPVEAEACRYKLKYNPEKPSLYITLTDDGDGPLEIFFSTLDAQTQEALDGLALTLTTLFRRGIDCQHLIEKYLRYESPTGGGWYNRKYVPSMLAGIGAVIRRHFEKMGYVSRDIYLKEIAEENIENGKLHGERCPNCGEYAVVPMEGCAVCTSCGHSQCG